MRSQLSSVVAFKSVNFLKPHSSVKRCSRERALSMLTPFTPLAVKFDRYAAK